MSVDMRTEPTERTGADRGFVALLRRRDPRGSVTLLGLLYLLMRFDDLDSAIEVANRSPYGNGASIFTRSGKAAREFKHRIQCGMVGINIGVPASMAWFPFNGWNESFFGDLHMQGKEGVQFFTQQKVTTSRWFSYGEGDIWHTEKK